MTYELTRWTNTHTHTHIGARIEKDRIFRQDKS